jgi:hypothetical protein
MKKQSVALLGKIAGFILLQRTMSASTSLLESLLAGLAAIAVLALVSALLFGAFILGSVYVGYQALLASGYTALQAALIAGGAILCLLLAAITGILFYIRKIRGIPKRLVMNEAPVAGAVSHVVEAFVEGFRKPQAKS